ncbi:MAG: ORF6N domain-containing protein, partial [Bacilli bacterium]|nr:ORF6N domain-containing protein [Bacilli bacterium]
MRSRCKRKEPGSFPLGFCFRITEEERDCLRSQIATFTERTRDRKSLPYVFTEQGIIALAGVLRSGLADRMAVEISRVFVSMRRFI